MAKQTRSTLANSIAMNEWQKLVKAMADHKCELCGSSDQELNAHHIFKKSTMFMKTLLDNGIALCGMRCHFEGIHSPDWQIQREFNDKILEYVGNEKIENLILLRNCPPKISLQDLKDLKKEYKLKLKQYE